MKDYREKEIKYLYISYVLLFLYWSTNTFAILTQSATGNWIDILSITDSDAKDKLVGLFLIPRAGATFFSRLLDGKIIDDRFSKQEAKIKYNGIIQALPAHKKERRSFENVQWYRIYAKYQDKGSVSQAQRDYLLCRDLYVDTIAFAFMYFMAVGLFHDKVHLSLEFTLTLLFIAVLTNWATHKKMNRFVNNVIALDIALQKQQDANEDKGAN